MFTTYTAFGFLHLRYRFNVTTRLTKSNVLHDLANWFLQEWKAVPCGGGGTQIIRIWETGM